MKFTEEAGGKKKKKTKQQDALKERGCPLSVSPLSPPRLPWVRPWLRPAGKWRLCLWLWLFTAPVRAAHVTAGGAAPVPAGIGHFPARGDGTSPAGSAPGGGDAPAACPRRGAGRSGAGCGPQSAPHRPGPQRGWRCPPAPGEGWGVAPSFASPAAFLGFAPTPPSGGGAPQPRAAGRCWGTHRKFSGGNLAEMREGGFLLRFCFAINPILTGKGRLSLPPAGPGFLKQPTGSPRMRRCSQPARARLSAALPRSESSSDPSPSRRGCPAPRCSALPWGKQPRGGSSSLHPLRPSRSGLATATKK